MLDKRIDDMNLSYQLFADKFEASPESVFEQGSVKKVLSQTVDSENGECFYGVIKFKTFNAEKILSKIT